MKFDTRQQVVTLLGIAHAHFSSIGTSYASGGSMLSESHPYGFGNDPELVAAISFLEDEKLVEVVQDPRVTESPNKAGLTAIGIMVVLPWLVQQWSDRVNVDGEPIVEMLNHWAAQAADYKTTDLTTDPA